MANLKFGTYLVERGIVTAEDVVQALDLQARTKLRFGAIALKCGLLSRGDVLLILEAQRRETPAIGELLIKSGRLSKASLEPELAAFRLLLTREVGTER